MERIDTTACPCSGGSLVVDSTPNGNIATIECSHCVEKYEILSVGGNFHIASKAQIEEVDQEVQRIKELKKEVLKSPQAQSVKSDLITILKSQPDIKKVYVYLNQNELFVDTYRAFDWEFFYQRHSLTKLVNSWWTYPFLLKVATLLEKTDTLKEVVSTFKKTKKDILTKRDTLTTEDNKFFDLKKSRG